MRAPARCVAWRWWRVAALVVVAESANAASPKEKAEAQSVARTAACQEEEAPTLALPKYNGSTGRLVGADGTAPMPMNQRLRPDHVTVGDGRHMRSRVN